MATKFTFSDVLSRYRMERTTLSKFLARHLSEINADGIHAAKKGRSWEFDSCAVQIMDRIRNAYQPGVVQSDSDLHDTDKAEIEALKAQVSNLQVLLLAAQKETLAAKSETIAALRERDKLKNDLSVVSMQYARLEAGRKSQTDISDRFKKEAEDLRKQNGVLQKQVSDILIDIQTRVQHPKVAFGKGWIRRGFTRKIKIHKI